MLKSKRYLYVGFMCHQVVEKILKAFYTGINNEVPPYTHSLLYLAEKTGIIPVLNEEQKDFLSNLEPMNIEARYPAYKDLLLKSLTEEKCTELISKTKEFKEWVTKKL